MSFTTMYIATTGMLALGTGMQTIGNNLANVNTTGFKTMRTNYEDLISECYYSGGNHNQVGRGAKVSTVQSMFTQGAFRKTEGDTDLAIAGNGFFNVRQPRTGEIMYTRAGAYTWDKNGYLEDPSGNILQGWQMSVPKPGQEAVRIGNPVDIQVANLTVPPIATDTVRMVTNLNAADQAAYPYPALGPAQLAAAGEARSAATAASLASALAVWNPAGAAGTGTDQPIAAVAVEPPAADDPPPAADDPLATLVPSNNTAFNAGFIQNYNTLYGVGLDADAADQTVAAMAIVADNPDRSRGEMTQSEFDSLVARTTADMEGAAQAAGQSAYDRAYPTAYKTALAELEAKVADAWSWEGLGFAGAWDPSQEPPMSEEDYTYSEGLDIYDELGNKHELMVYYQKNPHMENVWDYIVTCNPDEDARAAGDGAALFTDEASFAGLLQKGKITFVAKDDPSGHGGQIKDIEAQNLDLAASRAAAVDPPQASNSAGASFSDAVIGGYYTGTPGFDPATGQALASDRTYTLTWGYQDPATGQWQAERPGSSPVSGLTWRDDQGQTGFIPVSSKDYPGPYEFGSGLTVSFDQASLPLSFGQPGVDSLGVTAHSEQAVWSQAQVGADGMFEVNLSFAGSGVSATPPYPDSLPTVSQTVSLDLGAKKDFSNRWVLDETSTTQYAETSLTLDNQQNGYPEGSLQRAYVREDGMVIGIYDHKREEDLYQICLTTFLNPNGLDKRGENLFSRSRYADEGVTSIPGQDGAGQIKSTFLEQSNVDTATEIVNMISTQRGFQANSKSVTTTDAVLATAIQMKR